MGTRQDLWKGSRPRRQTADIGPTTPDMRPTRRLSHPSAPCTWTVDRPPPRSPARDLHRPARRRCPTGPADVPAGDTVEQRVDADGEPARINPANSTDDDAEATRRRHGDLNTCRPLTGRQRPSRCRPAGGTSAPGGAARRSTTGCRMHDRAFKGGRSVLRTRGAKRPTHRPGGPQLVEIRRPQECGKVCSFDGQEPRGVIRRGHAAGGARAGAESASFGAHDGSLDSAPGQSVGTPLSAPAV